jgi:hypothetical protein
MADIRNDYYDNRRSGPVLESDAAHFHPLVSWRSVVAGLFVSFLTLAILLSLGIAFGGIGLDDGTTAQNAGIFSGVWFLVSSLIALFAGSYFAARISKFQNNRLGSAQGLVIASLFFGLFLWQTATALGWAGRAAGSAVSGASSAVGQGVSQLSGNQVVNNIVDDAIGDLNLRSEPSVVAQGVASRLISGNTEGAKNYLARQAGITPAEADQRIAALRSQVDQALVTAREQGAAALKALGWTLFATLLLGAAASVGGGALGSRANLRKPLTREQADAVEGYSAAPV